MIADNKANILITPRLGENAADVLNAAEIKIYKTTAASARDNINKKAQNQGKVIIMACRKRR